MTQQTSILPTPSQLIPELSHYPDWYPGQDRMLSQVLDWLSGPKRFLGVEAPTGSGKSLLSILAPSITQRRAVILTATKGLQDQLVDDFEPLMDARPYGSKLWDIRGQNNYPCVETSQGPGITVDLGICHTGAVCEHRNSTCTYFAKALPLATRSRIVSTNYAWYLSQINYAENPDQPSMSERDLLICDEAHLAIQQLETFLEVRVTLPECDLLRMDFPTKAFDEWEGWQLWAAEGWMSADMLIDHMKAERQSGEHISPRDFRRIVFLARKFERLATSKERWAVDFQPTGSANSQWQFLPVWPGEFSGMLFKDTKKIMLMSASLTSKALDLLMIPESDREILHIPSSFPAANTPVQWIDTVRMNHRSTHGDLRFMFNRVDQIIDSRLDRKGIVFTVSYARVDLLIQHSRHWVNMITHDNRNVVDQVQRFRDAGPGAILVSPTVTSGWDFPLSDCEYIIIIKVPYPDTRPPAIHARNEEDKEWASFTAMETLVQEAGRGSRTVIDRCEVFILDNNWKWFWKDNKRFAPEWFHHRVLSGSQMVKPPIWEPIGD